MQTFKTIARWAYGLFFILAGVAHFAQPVFYLQGMPPYLPFPIALIYISGFFEILFGGMLLFKKLAPLAGIGLILLLVAIFPANVHMAANAQQFPDIDPTILWLRLPLQFFFIWWAYSYVKPEGKRGRERPSERSTSPSE